uniref:Golgi associated RAB2 interactor 1A n=1 Tax=Oryctolagus cuniculus TaxID=9986 RepID=G1TVD6_RABIT
MRKTKGLSPVVREPGPGVKLGVEDGLLCQLIHSPEFNLFSGSAVFESNFIQVPLGSRGSCVTKSGTRVDICGRPAAMILGVTSSVPSLPLPNVLLMANVTWPHGHCSTCNKPGAVPVITLNRLRIFTEKIYYLRLHEKHPEAVFQFWIRLVKILQHGLSITTKDPRIQFTHCLVPKRPSSSPEATPESSFPSSSQPSETLMLLAAEQTSGSFSELSGRAQFTADRSITPTIDIADSNSCDSVPSLVASQVHLNIPMRAALSHSLWEQEDPDEHRMQAPVASSLGQNFLGP